MADNAADDASVAQSPHSEVAVEEAKAQDTKEVQETKPEDSTPGAAEVKQEPAEVKQDPAEVKQDPAEVKQDSPEVKQDSPEVKQDAAEGKQNGKEPPVAPDSISTTDTTAVGPDSISMTEATTLERVSHEGFVPEEMEMMEEDMMHFHPPFESTISDFIEEQKESTETASTIRGSATVPETDASKPSSLHSSFLSMPGDRYPYLSFQAHDYSFAQMEQIKIIDPEEANKKQLTPVFLDLMNVKNKDKTRYLVLRGNKLIHNLKRRLDDKDLMNIRTYLQENKVIVSLDLSYNYITSNGLQDHLIPLLLENKTLKELVLSNNEICLKGVEGLSDVSSQIHLESLRLNGNKLGPKSGPALARLVGDSPTLLHLDVGDTDQGLSSLACLAAVLRSDYSPCSVTRSHYDRHPSETSRAPVREAKVCSPSELALYTRRLVARHVQSSPSSGSLAESEKSRIDCLDAIDWTQPARKIKVKRFAKRHTAATEETWSGLDDDSKARSDVDVKCPCQTLSDTGSSLTQPSLAADELNKPILQVLFLGRILGHYHYQPLTYHIARIASDMIRVNNSLKEIHLDKNRLSDGDVEILCQGLRGNTSLRLLDLASNQVACLGLSHLADTLPSTNLQALILNHNAISDYGARCLFMTLPSTKLQMLDLAHNSITDEGMMHMLYTMRKHPRILALYLWANKITQRSFKKIEEYLISGWIQTEHLDLKMYEVDQATQAGCKSWVDPFKENYYRRPPPATLAPPPRSLPHPLDFKHHHLIYSRTLDRYIPKTFLYPPDQGASCST